MCEALFGGAINRTHPPAAHEGLNPVTGDRRSGLEQ
jgi:hypothetical protein